MSARGVDDSRQYTVHDSFWVPQRRAKNQEKYIRSTTGSTPEYILNFQLYYTYRKIHLEIWPLDLPFLLHPFSQCIPLLVVLLYCSCHWNGLLSNIRRYIPAAPSRTTTARVRSDGSWRQRFDSAVLLLVHKNENAET